MGEKVLTLVSGDDWEGLYYDGKLIEEEHTIQRKTLVDQMKHYTTFNVEFKTINSVGMEWLQDEGSLPVYLDHINNDYFEQ
ncbi:hypothetical protein BC351_01225 [Paenibacillus ferrarius]|uniref:Uncharacterized protein n=1 Tax=Paenibacillus ferrarius TaxID=1469647 RepID=A0A1V4HST4_9BACL|nr:hypothetical protein [Paenibacillus ferrarius]OPH61892.1 hypothetical protein BC351_01225 [Paenibacillus ferrarius]